MTAKVIPMASEAREPLEPAPGDAWLSWLAYDELNHRAGLAAAQDDSPLSPDDAEDQRALAAFVEGIPGLLTNRERQR